MHRQKSTISFLLARLNVAQKGDGGNFHHKNVRYADGRPCPSSQKQSAQQQKVPHSRHKGFFDIHSLDKRETGHLFKQTASRFQLSVFKTIDVTIFFFIH